MFYAQNVNQDTLLMVKVVYQIVEVFQTVKHVQWIHKDKIFVHNVLQGILYKVMEVAHQIASA